MNRQPVDAEAIAASLADPPAFALIFERHFATVHGYLRRRLDRQLADGSPRASPPRPASEFSTAAPVCWTSKARARAAGGIPNSSTSTSRASRGSGELRLAIRAIGCPESPTNRAHGVCGRLRRPSRARVELIFDPKTSIYLGERLVLTEPEEDPVEWNGYEAGLTLRDVAYLRSEVVDSTAEPAAFRP